MQQFTTAALRHLYDMSRDLTSTRAKRGLSVACARTSTGDQRHVLTKRPPYGTPTFVRGKIQSVTPDGGLSTDGLVCHVHLPNLTRIWSVRQNRSLPIYGLFGHLAMDWWNSILSDRRYPGLG
jgi:hypothetical protein